MGYHQVNSSKLVVSVSKDTVGYIRLSVLNRDPHGPVENQRLMIEEWGRQHQLPIIRYYIDNGFSGKRFDRPAFQEMLCDIEKGKIDCVVVKDLSRLGRNYITMGYYLEMFFPSNNENPSQLVPDTVAAVIVRKIFEMAASGTGVTGIAPYLNEQGLPTPIQYARAHGLNGNFDDGNGSWNSRSVKYILTNWTYTGMLVQGKEKRAVEATHEPLVDSATFDAIQRAFQDRAYNVVP